MARRQSTPGQRARLYLEAHRDARMTALPGEHQEARKEIMRQLSQQDPSVRDRALVGSDRHFDRPLSKPEKAYQQHWQREEGLDVGQVRDARAQLEQPHEQRRRPVPPRPSQTRPTPRSRVGQPLHRRAAGYIRDTAATAATVPSYVTQTAKVPSAPSASGGLGLFYGTLTAAVAFSMLYLLLTKSSVATNLVGLATTSFTHIASPSKTLWEKPGPTAASDPLASYLTEPASFGVAAVTQTVPSDFGTPTVTLPK